jgi:hypothetical protein
MGVRTEDLIEGYLRHSFGIGISGAALSSL